MIEDERKPNRLVMIPGGGVYGYVIRGRFHKIEQGEFPPRDFGTYAERERELGIAFAKMWCDIVAAVPLLRRNLYGTALATHERLVNELHVLRLDLQRLTNGR